MRIKGVPENIVVSEKRKGDRSFLKVSFKISDLDNISYDCYFWAGLLSDLPPDFGQKEILAVVRKATKSELLLKIVEEETAS